MSEGPKYATQVLRSKYDFKLVASFAGYYYLQNLSNGQLFLEGKYLRGTFNSRAYYFDTTKFSSGGRFFKLLLAIIRAKEFQRKVALSFSGLR